MGRFSQAISEGDGISVVPLLAGHVRELAALAEEAGAEALAVWKASDVEDARSQTGLPVLLREPELDVTDDLRLLESPRADACILVFERWAGSDALENVHARLVADEVDCVVDVRDEEELEQALARIDPEIILVSERDLPAEEDPLERVLDLLPDVPAGKLVIAESNVVMRDPVLALERAGVDAVIVENVSSAPDFSRAVEELVGGTRRRR